MLPNTGFDAPAPTRGCPVAPCAVDATIPFVADDENTTPYCVNEVVLTTAVAVAVLGMVTFGLLLPDVRVMFPLIIVRRRLLDGPPEIKNPSALAVSVDY